MTIKLEAGKQYLTATGIVTPPLRSYHVGPYFDVPESTPKIGNSLWCEDGTEIGGANHLVSLAVPPEPAPVITAEELNAASNAALQPPAAPEPRKVKVGDMIRVLPCATGTAEDYRGEVVQVTTVASDAVHFRDHKGANDGDTNYLAPLLSSEWEFADAAPVETAAPEPEPVKVVAGGFYLTANGVAIGPMRVFPHGGFINAYGDACIWDAAGKLRYTGTKQARPFYAADIVAVHLPQNVPAERFPEPKADSPKPPTTGSGVKPPKPPAEALTLWDRYAMAALPRALEHVQSKSIGAVANVCANFADAMMAERAKRAQS